MTHVGFVGVGRMGTPMVARLVGAGHQVTVLGRTEEKRTAITELGASAATTVADVVDGADVVAVCVFTDDQVRQLCLDGELVAMMAVSYTHLTLPTMSLVCRSRWSPYH